MDKLIIKLWKIKNLVAMQVLSQPEDLRGSGMIMQDGFFRMYSNNNPNLGPHELLIRGTDKCFDHDVSGIELKNEEAADTYIKRVCDIVRKFNTERDCTPDTPAEMQEYIAD